MTLPAHLNPLSGAHWDQVHEALRKLNDALQVIQAAQSAGMDTTAHSQFAAHLQKQLHGVRDNFFPNGRPKP